MTRSLREKDHVDADKEALERLQDGLRVVSSQGLQDDLDSADFLRRVDETLDDFIAEGESHTEILRALKRFVEEARYPSLAGANRREAIDFIGVLLYSARDLAVTQ